MSKQKKPELLWASRVRQQLDPEALAFSSSIDIDRRLYREDIAGSIAHAKGLVEAHVITGVESKKIVAGLRKIEREIESGSFTFFTEQEDIHTAIEQRLTKLIGPVAGKLHTGRSRNDQVALDERLFLREAVSSVSALIRSAQRNILALAERNRDVIMPGYTHLQHAQPVLCAHYLMSWMEMLERDRTRLQDCVHRADFSPLGAAAFAGTPFPIDAKKNATRMKFSGVFTNSIDAVSDRDAIIEFVSACAILQMHLSRFCEDVVIFSSAEFGILDCGDAFTTGSSIMPHKRNPDIAELLRGRTGGTYGALMAILTTMKGVPLTYSRDLQEDKRPLFDATDNAIESLSVFSKMTGTMRFNEARCAALLEINYITATEIADYLVERGLPFREAHRITGKIVEHASREKASLRSLTLTEFKAFSPLFDKRIHTLLDPRASIQRKESQGGTSPKEVNKQIQRWKKAL